MNDLIGRIKNLTELYDRLSTDSRIVVGTDDINNPIYLTTHFSKDYACVQIASQVKSTTGPTHVHAANEWFFVLKGEIVIISDVGSTTLLPGMVTEIAGGKVHTITAVEDSIFLIITMPSILNELGLK